MSRRRIALGLAVLSLALAGGVSALAATAPPTSVTIRAVTSQKVVINRYVRDGLRWQRDDYTVKSGGTIHLLQLAADEGPHSFSIVNPKDAPKTVKQLNDCKICKTLSDAHGADPNQQGPPKFNFLENGTGQDTAPNVDRPGDSAIFGNAKGDTQDLKVTAPKGKNLYFMCIIHPQMQAMVHVR
jgi:hypothetical protein